MKKVKDATNKKALACEPLECGDINIENRIKRVLFNPETKEVLNTKGRRIGIGEMVGDILSIKMDVNITYPQPH